MSHYYEKTAIGIEPRHFVPVASRPGELRATTIRDAKKFGWVPSVTTIAGILDKPALTNWKIDEHLKIAYDFGEQWKPSGDRYSLDEYIAEVKRDTQAALDKAPKDGTDFHDSMEQFILGSLPESHEHFKYAAATTTYMREKTGVDSHVWEPERSFVHPMGFAGKVDANYSKSSVGNLWVCDFKTKNTSDKWKPGRMAYPEMAMQLAAYRVGLGLDNARCANVFICLEDGAVEFYEWKQEMLDKQWANFADLLRIWLRNAEYMPGSKLTENS